MHIYFSFFGTAIPSYGLMIVVGLILANALAYYIVKKNHLDYDNMILLEAYGLLGVVIGAKTLFILTLIFQMGFNFLLSKAFLLAILGSGYSFLGGIAGIILTIFLCCRIHRFDPRPYIRHLFFLFPFVHGFCKIGCFMAGCCYGIEYNGFGEVVFPHESLAPSGIPLFPVQIVEAICLFIISILIFFLVKKCDGSFSIETYLISYGIVRFILEWFRFESHPLLNTPFTLTQWFSIIFILLGLTLFTYNLQKLYGHRKSYGR
ncbi:MAG: prolipoprotein diacylglyceryl transferase [Butyrivibrio sp.]|nr:prolipoprotein diacylglyceryl transferase [Butyrivibrio sp.]